MIHKHLNILTPLLIFVLSLIFYITLAGKLTYHFETHPANYFSYLSLSFLHGRLDLQNPAWNHDLSPFRGKFYMYWGPTPVLLILPVVYIFGLGVSDKLYTAIYASLSPLILYFILNELKNTSIILNLSRLKKALISLFFAFGTVHLYLSADGGVWSTSQIFSTLYILISLLFMLKYAVNKKIINLTLGTIFFGLGFVGRPTLFFYIIFYLTLIFISNYLDRKNSKRLKNHVLIFSVIICFFFVLEGIYNFARFGSILETGHTFHNAAGKFIEDRKNFGEINLHYIPTNLYYLFVNIPQVKTVFPFFDFSLDGNSIFFTSPLFVLAFLLAAKKFWQRDKLIYFNLSILTSIVIIIAFLLVYFSTGFIQFGYRYALDFIPLLIILLAEVASTISLTAILPLFIWSLIINVLGGFMVFKIFSFLKL